MEGTDDALATMRLMRKNRLDAEQARKAEEKAALQPIVDFLEKVKVGPYHYPYRRGMGKSEGPLTYGIYYWDPTRLSIDVGDGLSYSIYPFFDDENFESGVWMFRLEEKNTYGDAKELGRPKQASELIAVLLMQLSEHIRD